ncbi:MAG TPA: crosslink repair DNA glycosylase YcaQ family protein [Myxococcaceae bacterium]|nr:crosslink repair DNA glycosylase YcaQ family protein [Myxococcaceae bacterium]
MRVEQAARGHPERGPGAPRSPGRRAAGVEEASGHDTLELTAEQARRFLVRRHFLAPPRALPARAESVLRVVRELGSVQFDPLEVTGARNDDLVLAARIRNYRRGWMERWLYGARAERQLFEAYNKSLNILPVEELPVHRVDWEQWHRRDGAYQGLLHRHADIAQAILERLEREGALPGSAFVERGGQRLLWGWGSVTVPRAVLYALFRTGQIGIARRVGNVRVYDRIERLFPGALLDTRLPDEEVRRHQLLSRFRGVGLLGLRAGAEIWSGTVPARQRLRLTEAMVADGTLRRVRVQGVRDERFMLAADARFLRGGALRTRGVALLAPLDPLVWDRELLRQLFDFDYVWEVYVPAKARKHGYYVLPLLWGDRLVGRIEPRIDRKAGVLRVPAPRLEHRMRRSERLELDAALDRALEAHRRLSGAERIERA